MDGANRVGAHQGTNWKFDAHPERDSVPPPPVRVAHHKHH
jgi:hypothetical protein